MHQETVVLRPRIFKPLILCLVSAAFFVGGLWMVKDNAPNGWFVTIFFGIVLLVSLLRLLPGANSLTLTPSGFIMKSLFRSHFIAWEAVQSFQLGKLAGEDAVYFNYHAHHRLQLKAKQFNHLITGNEAALPDTYGLTAENLRSLLEAWKMKSGKPKSHNGTIPVS